ncbi:hypothetical protein ACTXPX_11355 [Glutamicibacter arilaitensis]
MREIKIEELLRAGRAASLTSTVMEECACKGNPKQWEFLTGY